MTIPARDKDEAIRCVRYQIRLHFLHHRLYMRIRRFISFASLLLGSTALYGAFKESPAALGVAGIAVAVLGAADLVMDWANRAARHDAWRRRMANLLARSSELQLGEIDRELAELEGDVDDEIESLRKPANNDVLRANGLEVAVQKESVRERLYRFIA